MIQDKKSTKEKLTGDLPQAHILSIDEIFFSDIFPEICRPDFQRPYRWRKEHVEALLNDLKNDFVKEKEKRIDYFLGTITIYYDEENQKRNIVDGLQRLTTLYLILGSLKTELCSQPIPLFFAHKDEEGQANIRANYKVINEWLKTNSLENSDLFNFIRTRCFVAWNEVGSYDEAFQVFEGRNTKGKALKPHDLLKAFHYRKFSADIEKLKDFLKKWEQLDEDNLHRVFETLYRIRAWSKGNYDAWEFTKNDRRDFHGFDKITPDPKSSRIEYFYQTIFEKLKENYSLVPEIFNGEYFFDWTFHQFEHFPNFADTNDGQWQKPFSFNGEHKDTIGKFFIYSGARRTGDSYCQAVLRALLMLYQDRFLPHEIEPNSDSNNAHEVNYEKLFNFVYRRRIEQSDAKRDSPITITKMLKMLEESRIFERMNQAYSLEDFSKIPIEQVDWKELQGYKKLSQ